jgi:ABC-type Fe3+-siderophore transport system permease subunit
MLLQVTPQITFTNPLIDNDTFGVTLPPGGDYAFVIALLVIMDAI